jgi:transcriptional regulator with XRE-family HTH domain
MPETTSETRERFHDPREVTKRRIRAGLMQLDLAERAGVSRGTIAKAESESYTGPSPRTLKRIADALGCTIEDLERKPATVAS